jgi:phosphatidylserine/phosphatidylglycerophosphate/cardiolipin synthase-like enzyme
VLSGKDADWGDQRTVRDLFNKVIPLVQGLEPSITGDAADELVRKWMVVRRIGSDFGPNSIHTKTICVDEQLLYVGSDNLYPSYNEEHGIWVDDKATLSDWVQNYWNAMWPNLKVPDLADYHASSS